MKKETKEMIIQYFIFTSIWLSGVFAVWLKEPQLIESISPVVGVVLLITTTIAYYVEKRFIIVKLREKKKRSN